MSELNVDQARYNMIEQQVRTWDVLDQQVLDVLATTPRERFVPERYRNLAFADVEIPIGYGEVMMMPKVEGRLLQALAVQDTDRALEIGTGSGYLTACLAKLAASVVTVELEQELSQAAHQRLAGLELENVEYRIGDAADGWIEDGRFEVIAVTGSVPVLPEGFKQQLTVGGRLFIIVGDKPVMNEREWTTESLFETELPPLKNASRPAQFVF
jgi:protein-L-isoaspartate(D-aspartate) O-methyltransferase